MKVGIITFHFVNNFGGALQAYALKSACEECGVNAHVVDYRQWFIRFTDAVRMFPICKNPKVISAGFKTMTQRISRRKRFDKFQHEYMSLSDRYYSAYQLNSNPPGYDKYVCGSDQIWNPFITCGVDSPYFLSFEPEPRNKFAYAPSFGSSTIAPRYIGKIKTYLTTLGDVSVRESEGVDIVKRLTGRRCEQLIDPTFLVPFSRWGELADVSSAEIEYKQYILVYIMQQDNTVYEYARRLKEKYGIPVVEIGRYGYKAPFVDKCIVDLGPLEFLNLFKNATHVCTNSYHGLIFSIIFEKKICVIPCKRFKSRIDSLTKLFGIAIGDSDGKLELDVAYDINAIKERIATEKSKSMEYISKNLEA